MMESFAVVRWRSLVDRVAQSREDLTWDELARVLVPAAGAWPAARTKETLPGWSPVRLRPDEAGVYRRKAPLVEHMSLLVLDLDEGDPLDQVAASVDGVRAIVHTTWSHTPELPKYRMVVALTEPVPVSRWEAVWAAGARWAGARGVRADRAAKDACRLYFLPARHPEREAFAGRSEGVPLSWRRLLTDYPAPSAAPPLTPTEITARRRTLYELEGGGRVRAAAYLGGIVRGLAGAAEGGRNQAAFRAGAALGGLAAAGDVAVADWRGELVQAAMNAGLDRREAEEVIDNGVRRGLEDGPKLLADRG
jgi:hypothetical protein